MYRVCGCGGGEDDAGKNKKETRELQVFWDYLTRKFVRLPLLMDYVCFPTSLSASITFCFGC